GALALLGCARTPEPAHAPSTTGTARPSGSQGSPERPDNGSPSRTEIHVDPELTSGPPERLGAWILYGVTLADKAGSATHSGYPAEVRARTLLADAWKEKRGPTIHDRYLDLLVEVRQAGFIAEYVLAFLS